VGLIINNVELRLVDSAFIKTC